LILIIQYWISFHHSPFFLTIVKGSFILLTSALPLYICYSPLYVCHSPLSLLFLSLCHVTCSYITAHHRGWSWPINSSTIFLLFPSLSHSSLYLAPTCSYITARHRSWSWPINSSTGTIFLLFPSISLSYSSLYLAPTCSYITARHRS